MSMLITEKQAGFMRALFNERQHLLDQGYDGVNADALKFVSACVEANAVEKLERINASRLIDKLLAIRVPKAAAPGQAKPVKAAAGPCWIKTGTYTVVLNNGADYVTLRVETEHFTGENKTMVSFLYGPDNTVSYKGFAFADAAGIHVWKRYGNETRIVEAARVLWAIAETENGLGEAHEEFLRQAEAYAMMSNACMRCGRELTVPTSLHRGLGPTCAEIEGIA